MTIKVTFYFRSELSSWSEAHYSLGTSDFPTTEAPAAQLATARASLLGSFANLVAVRMSNVPANRQVQDVNSSLWNGGSTLTTAFDFAVNNADQPFTALMLNFKGATSNKNLYLAGIPDAAIVVDPSAPNGYAPDSDYNLRLTVWGNIMLSIPSGNRWGYRIRVRAAGQQVVGVGQQPGFNNNAAILTANNPGVIAGQDLYLKGFRVLNPREPGLAGAYTVLAVVPPASGFPNWSTVLQETGNVNPNNFLALGTAAPLSFTYEQYLEYNVIRATHRKRGASFARPRGRSRARR